jgi:hypothetical protein
LSARDGLWLPPPNGEPEWLKIAQVEERQFIRSITEPEETMSAFKPAARTAIKIKIAVSGPSGSGKTMGALALAKGLGPRVALIDTENGSASSYAGRYAFDVLELGPPFTSKRYLKAIDDAVAAGYDVLVIDSLSHQWNGTGGILSRKEEADKRPNSNSYTNWNTFTKEHTAFIENVLHAPIHIVATLRSKQDYVLAEKNGKQVPQKVGMAPIQREGLEYEFTTVFELQMDHRAIVSKDRTDLWDDRPIDLCDPKVAADIRHWLDAAPPKAPADTVMPLGQHKNERLGDIDTEALAKALTGLREKDEKRYAPLISTIELVLEERR